MHAPPDVANKGKRCAQKALFRPLLTGFVAADSALKKQLRLRRAC
jgi:hypothetical protein